MREGFVNFLGLRFCEFGFYSVNFFEFKMKTLQNLRAKICEFFMAVNLFKFLLNFCKKIQGFCEFKVKNSQKLRLKCFEFFKQFKQGYEFKRKIHAFTRIKNV